LARRKWRHIGGLPESEPHHRILVPAVPVGIGSPFGRVGMEEEPRSLITNVLERSKLDSIESEMLCDPL